MSEKKQYTVTAAQANLTLQQFLRQELNYSARDCQKMLRKQWVLVNRKRSHSQKKLAEGDTISLRFCDMPVKPAKHSGKATLSNTLSSTNRATSFLPKLEILYEDSHTLIVDKPPFCLVHPTSHTKQGTLSQAIEVYFRKRGSNLPARPVHRLDRDTSGCLIFAKSKRAQTYYTEALTNNKVHKEYLAFVEGLPSPKSGTITLPIGIDPQKPNRRCIRQDGQFAQTHYCLADSTSLQLSSYLRQRQKEQSGTLLLCTLSTGRTHQIRIHLAHMGHPLCGDAMYGKGKQAPLTRQCLHAYQITFTPYGQTTPVTVTAPLSKDFGCEKKIIN